MTIDNCTILEEAEKIPLETKCKNLIAWLTSDPEFSMSKNLKIQKDKFNGIGLFYDNTIDSEDVVLNIPSKFLINRLTCIEYFKGPAQENSFWKEIFNKYICINTIQESWNSFHIIILYMYIEWFCIDVNENSFHKPFFESLPASSFFEENIPVLQYLTLSDDCRSENGEKLKKNLLIEFENEFAKLLENIILAENTLLPVLKNFSQNISLVKKRLRYLYMCINSRCLYYEVKRNNPFKEDNLTLVPLVDFINHTDGESEFNSFVEVTKSMNLAKQNYRLHVKKKKLLTINNELLFKYGCHNDCLLLNDYGFILQTPNPNNFNDVTEIILSELNCYEIEYLKQISYFNDGDRYFLSPSESSMFFNTQIAIYVMSLNLDFPNLKQVKQFPKIKQMKVNNYIKTMESTKNFNLVVMQLKKKYNKQLEQKISTLKQLSYCPKSIIELIEKYYIQEI
ncbi:hypothetical protein QEN19_001959 [Hanseniaspora menglaensis]